MCEVFSRPSRPASAWRLRLNQIFPKVKFFLSFICNWPKPRKSKWLTTTFLQEIFPLVYPSSLPSSVRRLKPRFYPWSNTLKISTSSSTIKSKTNGHSIQCLKTRVYMWRISSRSKTRINSLHSIIPGRIWKRIIQPRRKCFKRMRRNTAFTSVKGAWLKTMIWKRVFNIRRIETWLHCFSDSLNELRILLSEWAQKSKLFSSNTIWVSLRVLCHVMRLKPSLYLSFLPWLILTLFSRFNSGL